MAKITLRYNCKSIYHIIKDDHSMTLEKRILKKVSTDLLSDLISLINEKKRPPPGAGTFDSISSNASQLKMKLKVLANEVLAFEMQRKDTWLEVFLQNLMTETSSYFKTVTI